MKQPTDKALSAGASRLGALWNHSTNALMSYLMDYALAH